MEIGSIGQMREWLSRPENTFPHTFLYIVRWSGSMPSICRTRTHLLEDDAFVGVLLQEHIKRRAVPHGTEEGEKETT